jgi:arginyl-tRNA synthetase
MDPRALRTRLAGAVDALLRQNWGQLVPAGYKVRVDFADDLRFGDLSCRAALELAGALRQPPVTTARWVADALAGTLPEISSVTVDGPGFLNFRLSADYLVSVCRSLASDGLGPMLPRHGEGKRALVEYVSSNPTGPLTVGHCRQAVLGESICRLLECIGWTVSREYYFNDAGRQMELLGRSLAARYDEARGIEAVIPEGGYQGSYIADWGSELLRERGEGLSWTTDGDFFVTSARERAMEMILRDLDLLGIRFDRFFSESELIPDRVEEVIARFRAARTDAGPLVFDDPDGSGKVWLRLTALGRPENRVIVRDNGMYTYRIPDIAYHVDKFGRGYDLMVDVFGSDHLDTSRDVRTALEALLGADDVERRLRIVIHQFVTLLRSGGKVKMSTRAGEFVTLEELVREVGSVDVTRYLFLTRRAESHMDFDLDLAKTQSPENPVYYVQYAHARISGILRAAEEAGIDTGDAEPAEISGLLDGEHERELMRLLESLPCRTADAADALEPHRITELLAELATGFHRFYQHLRVVDPAAPLLSSARLLLCRACRRGLEGLLEILGVEAPDRM